MNRLNQLFSYIARTGIACLCLENCRLCKKELSLSLEYDYSNAKTGQELHLPKTKIERALHNVSKIVCSESVYPALLKGADTPFLGKIYSHCLCYECWLSLKIDQALIGTCTLKSVIQKKLPVVSGAAYEYKVRDLIGRFKYDGDKLLATDLCYVMINAWAALSERIPASSLLLVPVPLHRHRLRNRGFNQAELLAQRLSLLTGVKQSNALSRTVHTKPQQTLGKIERLQNVKGAFKAKANLVQGKNVILVDDVCTSGATLSACAEELLRNGAASVAAITIARAVFWDGKDTA